MDGARGSRKPRIKETLENLDSTQQLPQVGQETIESGAAAAAAGSEKYLDTGIERDPRVITRSHWHEPSPFGKLKFYAMEWLGMGRPPPDEVEVIDPDKDRKLK